jgi:hypothetical protein
MSVKDLLVPVRGCGSLSGNFRLPRSCVLASVRSADVLPLNQLAGDLRKRLDLRSRVVRDAASKADVRIRRDRAIEGAESYRLTIAPAGVEILASGDAGAYYAVQTLRDLVAIHGRKLPACRIDDRPDFARRGVYEDCSRGKVPTVETVKQLVERLAHWKVNEFQLYIENVFTFRRHPTIGRGYSPFTPEDLLEIQDFCKLHHVTFVGSLTSFGHMEKILKLDEYAHLGEMPGYWGLKGGTTLCPTDPGSIRLVSDMYGEFAPLFEAEDFNSCCDETWELGKGRSAAAAAKVGVAKVYLDFLLKIRGLCEKQGKRMNAWADIILNHPEVLPKVPKDIVLLNWGYSPSDARIPQTPLLVEAGMPFMVCPGTGSWQAHGARITNSMANVANFAAMGRKCGAEGVLNTDWGDNGHRNFLGTSMHGFAHGAAHSWNGRAVDDATFTRRFCRQVFDQKNDRLARSLVALGDIPSLSSASGKNRSALYHMLVTSPATLSDPKKDPVEGSDEKGLKRVVSQAAGLEPWPAAAVGAETFEKLALREFALAARMDALAARRGIVLKTVRAGLTPPAAEAGALARDIGRMSGDFERLWIARNRPSRLIDNLRLFRKAATHLLKLASR